MNPEPRRMVHSERTRIAATFLAGPIFLGVLPFVVARIGPRLDRRLGVAALPVGLGWRTFGEIAAGGGFALGLWTVYTQVARGGGTPLPILPTQELLTDGPYRHSRNPMTLGAVTAYLGIALAARTPSGIGLVLGLAAALVVYLKLVEERELAARFGAAYLAYRRRTPFLVGRRSREA